MFDFLKKRKSISLSPFDAACRRLEVFREACMLCISVADFKDLDKADLAISLFFLGAADSCSQAHSLSDLQFADLSMKIFEKMGQNDLYAKTLARFFLDMSVNKSAMSAVLEGGTCFNKWIDGNKDIPLCSLTAIEEFCDDPDFPSSVGQLYVYMDGKHK